jgi:hypothetical protein
MSYLDTGSTELKAINQILASVGQAPVTTIETETTLVLNKVTDFNGYISGLKLFTQQDAIAVGTYIGGVGVIENTSVAVDDGVFAPSASCSGTTLTSTSAFIPEGVSITSDNITTAITVDSGPTDVGDGTFTYTVSASTTAADAVLTLDPIYHEYTLNINHTTPVGNTVTEQALTVSEVEERVENQPNPDVAIALNTLREVSREVQSEGWTFNREFNYELTPDSNNQVAITSNMLQVDLNLEKHPSNAQYDAINRGGKLYDRVKHTNVWEEDTVYVDILWYFDYPDIPDPIQAYIVAKAATLFSSRVIGDPNQYGMLQQKEQYARAQAIEYECTQGDYTFFGHKQGENFYNSYKPFHSLIR